MSGWKKISTKKILDHHRLTVYEDVVELPNGKKTTYVHFGEARDAVTAIAIRQDGKILVQKEFSYPSGEWLYQFPGGGLEERESPLAGIKRELAEEASLSGDYKQIGWFYPDNRRKRDKMYVFVVTKLKELLAEKDQEEDFINYWLDPSEISKLISRGEIVNYSTLSAWAIYSSIVD